MSEVERDGATNTDGNREFRLRVRSLLADRLRRRRGPAAAQAMGAGEETSSLAVGRRHLELMDPGGWAAPTWPVAYGGAGLTAEQLAILTSEMAPFEVPELYPFAVGIGMAGPVIIDAGTVEQQQRWLAPIRTGAEIWCQMFSEPDAGSDLASVTCKAERAAGGWYLSGQKLWTSRAHYSDWGLALARSDVGVPKHQGLTAFGVDMRSDGLVMRPITQMNGDAHFNEVFLDRVWVPDEQRIGAVGAGWQVALTTLAHERNVVARSTGMLGPDDVLRLAPRAGALDPTMRQRLVTVWSDLRVHQLTTMRAEQIRAGGGVPGPEGSGSKLRYAACFKAVTELAVDLLGAQGQLTDEAWTLLFLTAPSMPIRGGTDEIQRNIVGERVLGLPRDASIDRDIPFSDVLRTVDRAR